MTHNMTANFVFYAGGVFDPANEERAIPAVIEGAVAKAFAADPCDPDVETELFKLGVVNVESYACSTEAVEVYRMGSIWYVEHHTVFDCDARIIVEGLADYLVFQAQWLAPMALKIMKKGSWNEEQEQRANAAPKPESFH